MTFETDLIVSQFPDNPSNNFIKSIYQLLNGVVHFIKQNLITVHLMLLHGMVITFHIVTILNIFHLLEQ